MRLHPSTHSPTWFCQKLFEGEEKVPYKVTNAVCQVEARLPPCLQASPPFSGRSWRLWYPSPALNPTMHLPPRPHGDLGSCLRPAVGEARPAPPEREKSSWDSVSCVTLAK